MFPSDVIIGWISNGVTHFSDRHSTAHEMPKVDTHQDWHLLHGEENDFGTVLKFVRKIDTCDTNEDILIQDGTVRLIYSYNDVDPVSDNNITYHGVTRGTKSVWLLGAVPQPTHVDTDVNYFDLLNKNFVLKPLKTHYQCTGFQMPDLGGKHHLIKYEPVITPGNELHVHHILISRCAGINASVDGLTGGCDDDVWAHVGMCSDSMIAWAIGGEPFYFPDNTGYSINGTGDPTFYIMQTHYDNPTMKTGVIDNSGIRMTLTKNLRPIDVGLMEFGEAVNFFQVVPQNQPAFVTKTYCSETCLRDAFTDAQVSEIRVFAALQHEHLLGVGVKTRHFRNGTEIKPLMNDPNYDFNFQEMRLTNDVVIKPGDSISVECTYDSRGRPGPTFGGEGTHDEMCLTFAYYYPKLRVSSCMSIPLFNVPLGPGNSGKDLYHRFTTMDWDNSTVVADFKVELEQSPVYHMCSGAEFQDPHPDNNAKIWVETETQNPYVPPPTGCS